MKSEAWVWTSPGEPEGLKLESRVLLEPGVREICVENRVAAFIGRLEADRIRASGVERRACSRRRWYGRRGRRRRGVSHLRPGARVAYHADLRRDGGFARHTLIPARAVLSVPAGLSDGTRRLFRARG